MGDAWVPGPTANLEKLLNAQKQYRTFLTDAGKNPADMPNPLTREVVIAETRERAWELAEKYVMVNYRDEYGGGWKHPLIGSQDQTPVALESLSNGSLHCREPGGLHCPDQTLRGNIRCRSSYLPACTLRGCRTIIS